MAFFRHDADNLPALFPQALGDALEHGGFARAAGAEGGEVAVGIFVVVKEVHKGRGPVVEIQAQEDAARVAQLVGRERKRPGNPLCQGVAAAFVIVTTVCNIFGDWLLIYPMAWGTKGAAIATGISQTLGLLVILSHFIRKQGNLRFGKIKLEKSLFKEIIVHGLPEGISQLATPVMTFCMNMVLIDMVGDLGVNAFSAISYIASFSMAVFFGASEGLQPLFGQSYGAKKKEDLKFYFKAGLKISFFGSAAVTILAVLFGGYIGSLFGTDAVTREYMLKVLPQFAVGFIATAVNVMISSYLYSTERSLLALNISVLRSIIVNAAVILILPYVFGESIIWFSLLIYEVIVLIIAVALLKHSEKNGIHFKE